MTRADWEGVCDGMRTASGLFWPIPITLSTDRQTADSIHVGDEVALADDTGALLATLKVSEKYQIDKEHECASVFRTNDPSHPGVRMVMEQGEVNLAGPVKVISDGGFKSDLRRSFHDAGGDAGRVSAAWLVQRSAHFRRATRCTGPTSTWRRSRIETSDGV